MLALLWRRHLGFRTWKRWPNAFKFIMRRSICVRDDTAPLKRQTQYVCSIMFLTRTLSGNLVEEAKELIIALYVVVKSGLSIWKCSENLLSHVFHVLNSTRGNRFLFHAMSKFNIVYTQILAGERRHDRHESRYHATGISEEKLCALIKHKRRKSC